MKTPLSFTCVCSLLVCLTHDVFAQFTEPGSLDTTFQFGTTHAYLSNPFMPLPGTGVSGVVRASVVQPNGRVILAGNFSSYNGKVTASIIRIFQNGTLDTSFNAGFSYPNSSINTLKLLPDGQIIAGGAFDTINGSPFRNLARLKPNGTADTSFKTQTALNGAVRDMVLQPDGKLVIVGDFTSYNTIPSNYAARLHQDGTFDSTFQFAIGANSIIQTVDIQPDGKLWIGGEFATVQGVQRLVIARLHSDGTLDTTINTLIQFGLIHMLRLQADGKVIIAGTFAGVNSSYVDRFARLNTNGTLDLAFSLNTGLSGMVQTLAIQPDQKILFGGSLFLQNEPGVVRSIARFNPNGTVDTSFFTSENVQFQINSISVHYDGSVFIGGSFELFNRITRNGIAKLSSNGSVDQTFNFAPGVMGNTAVVNTIRVNSNGRVLVAGRFNGYNTKPLQNIASLLDDGTPDTSFQGPVLAISQGFATTVHALVPQSDNRILIAGDFGTLNGITRTRLARLHPDGQVDTTFDAGSGPGIASNPGQVHDIEVVQNGRIIVVGSFVGYNGGQASRIVRVLPNGFRDATFSSSPGANAVIRDIEVLPDGDLMVAGDFTTIAGTSAGRVARLNEDGTRDVGFLTGTGANNSVYAVKRLTDGKYLIAGAFTVYNGVTRNGIARLLPNGNLDITFDAGLGANDVVRSIAVETNGSIWIVGDFTTVNGVTRNRIARLLPNGSLDSLFDPGTGASHGITSIVLQPDNRAIIAGAFRMYSSIFRSGVARIHGESFVYGFNDETIQKPIIHIFPNPVDDKVFIKTSEVLAYEIVNNIGQTMQRGILNSPETILLTKEWLPGLYLFKAFNTKSQWSQKLIKK